MPKKGDDLTATASNLQQSNDSVLSAIKEKQDRPGKPTLVPAPGSESEIESKRTSDVPNVPERTAAEEREKNRKRREAAAKDAEEDFPTQEELDAQKKKREADKAKQAKLKAEAAKKAREEELAGSAWVGFKPKIKQKRQELLDRIYFKLKGEGEYTGKKQEFYDEAFAMLEEKYSGVVAK